MLFKDKGSQFEQILKCCSKTFENQQSLFHIQLVDDIGFKDSISNQNKKGTSPFEFQEAVKVLLLNIVIYSLDSSKPVFYFQSDKLAGFLCSPHFESQLDCSLKTQIDIKFEYVFMAVITKYTF